jgi:hypothetical protein
MLNVCTKGILVFYTFLSVKFNGSLEFAGSALTLFPYANNNGVDTVSVTVAN